MSTYPLARKIRSRKLGVLIYDARTSARRSPEECALALGITQEEYQAYEQGVRSPSLPEMELLAYSLGISLDHFWSNVSISETRPVRSAPPADRVIPPRQRMISDLLGQARVKAGLSLAELAEKIGIGEETIQAYESGQVAVPLPALETLASAMGISLDSFLDESGPVGQWRVQQERIQRFLELAPELQEFVSKPINHPYVELAQRLSNLSVERLRAIAEGLLEITY